MAGKIRRGVFLLHRYLGIALGLLVCLWCLSGFVMLYVQYPSWGPTSQLTGLPTLDLHDCCRVNPADLGPGLFAALRVEMHGRDPVALLYDAYGGQLVVNLRSGKSLVQIDAPAAADIARAFAAARGLDGAVRMLGRVQRDQWTVSGEFDAHRPLLEFAGGDPRGTRWYVSSTTGEVVQVTTARERFWNRLGAVIHWLYPTLLRQHVLAWTRVVVWGSLLCAFLTAVGLYVGVVQFRRRLRAGRAAYRGPALWHHYAGLLFGLFTLTWLVSGTFSMTPWPFLQSRSFAAEDAALRGGSLDAPAVVTLLTELPRQSWPAGSVRLEAARSAGRPVWTAWSAAGEARRLDRRGQPAPLTERYFRQAAERLHHQAPVRSSGWLREPDAYYFSHHGQRRFPVYRIVFADGERYYLDAVSGGLVLAVDSGQRAYRWLFDALHRGDFSSLVRSRPLWDLLMLALLAGVSVSALTGTWMGLRRLLRWLGAAARGRTPQRRRG